MATSMTKGKNYKIILHKGGLRYSEVYFCLPRFVVTFTVHITRWGIGFSTESLRDMGFDFGPFAMYINWGR